MSYAPMQADDLSDILTSEPLRRTLAHALTTRRPHGSKNVRTFTKWLRGNLPQWAKPLADYDCEGNLHIDARHLRAGASPMSRTLFVAHVDTVHRDMGTVNRPNVVVRDHHTLRALKDGGGCLGADDGAGVAMLMHMLHNGVPGYYVFTQGEECGGIGASHLASEYADLLAEMDRAIAFDRRGLGDVITHQGWGRCCSDAFAQALADALNNGHDSLMYTPDDSGVYTDTAEFVQIIPECTNISVGYQDEHGDRESLDLVHYEALATSVLTIDWDSLPTSRDPLVREQLEYRFDETWTSADYWRDDEDAVDKVSTTTTTDKYDRMAQQVLTQEGGYELYKAIQEAYHGRVGVLRLMVAQSVHPEEPGIVFGLMPVYFQPSALDEAEDLLFGGWPVDDVLYSIFEAATYTGRKH